MTTLLDSAIKRHPPTIAAHAFVQEAIVVLNQANDSCLLVVDAASSRLIGLFNERDVVQLMASSADVSTRPLSAVVTAQCLALNEADLQGIDAIVALFEQQQLCALPIVNDQGQPTGLITTSSLLQALSLRAQDSHKEIGNRQSLEISHQEAEIALRRQLKHTHLFQKLTDAIHAQCGSQRIFETTVTQLGQVFGISQCHLLTYTTAPTFRLAVAAEYAALESPMPIDELLLTENPYVLQILAQDHAIASPNVYANALLQPMEPLCQRLGLKSTLAVRTSYQGQPNGILTLHQCDRFRHWTQREVQLIEAIAAQVGMVLAQIDLLEQEQQQRQAIEQQNLILQQEIRERQAALLHLRQAEERWQLVVQASNDGIFDIDLTTENVFYSEQFKQILGYSKDEFSDTTSQWRDRIHPYDRDRVIATKEAYLRREIPQLAHEYRLRCKDGTYKWIFDRAIGVWDESGTPVRLLGGSTDISDRKQLELALKQSEAKLSHVLNSANAAIASIRVFGTHTWEVEYRSVGYERIFGFPLERFVADPKFWASQVVSDDLKQYQAQLVEDIFAGRSGVVEYRFYHSDGTIHWISEIYTPQWDAAANCWIVTTVDTNISDRKRIEETLIRQQEFLRYVIDTPPNLIFAKDWNGNFVLANQAVAEIYGTTVEDLIGKNDADFNPDQAEVEHFLQDDREVISTRQPKLIEETVTSAAGVSQCFQTIKKPITSIDGLSTLVLGVATDITDRKQMEQALRLIVEGTSAQIGHDFFHSLVYHLAEVLQVSYASIAELTKPGKSKAQTLAFWQGHELGENFAYDLAGTPCEQVLAGAVVYYQDSIQTHFPQDHYLVDLGVESYFGIPLNDSLGNVIGHISVMNSKPLPQNQIFEQILRIFAARAGAELERQQAEDLSSALLAQTQQQSIELEKARDAAESANRAKSNFLANMSHELRTPLNAILGFTQIMSHDRLLSLENREYVNIINRSGQHLLSLINDVLEMSKIEAGRLKLYATCFDLYHLLDTLYEMLHLKASDKHILLRFDRSHNLPQYITTDEGKLRQVLLNLLDNAIKFTQKGSVTLRVGVEREPASIGERESVGENPSSSHLFFAVEDTGPGLAPSELQRLFTPFVQTLTGQQSSEGTGLGLAISQKFVQLMGGTISVESVVGQGSHFCFAIQVCPAQGAPPSAPYLAQRVIGLAPDCPPYRVLIVEDLWENQQILEKLLKPAGFDVLVANNGQEGVLLWEHWHPHVILMDMRMPVLNGYEATQQIRAKESLVKRSAGDAAAIYDEPLTKIIAVTSSAFDEERSAILAMGCDDFISKPFREEVVFAKLAQHLGVQYLYETKDTVGMEAQGAYSSLPGAFDSGAVLDASSFDDMPDDWIMALHKAAILGKDRQMLKLIEQLPSTHVRLVQALQALVNNFHFEAIVELTTPIQR
ncbi:PAS domain S-box protein [Stenomitos frigidus]|uniref:Circadian input-output histidine kinase CikA n=1 Tax=Stenomitos frigidus ULC18 TaxID=2107698 RepID=A0A2T1E372_9CYAN|nr:PAS domain S-box protein [Stenomitos frigidus]PSB27188.1 hypothetical protein C7B82_17090 [Stenomitos frigidus ULC18]